MKMKTTALALLALALLLGCKPEPKPAEKTVGFPPKGPKALLAERVEGKSPWLVTITFAPEEPRAGQPTRFDLMVTDNHGPVRAADVRVSLVMPLMDMGKSGFEAKEVLPGVYEGTGTFAMADEWEVFVTVTRGGAKGTHVFNVRVAE